VSRKLRFVTYHVREPDSAKRVEMGVFSPRNCPVGMKAGDGTPLGRCDHWLGDSGNTCPVHGDVSDQEWILVKRVKLTTPQAILLEEAREAHSEGKTVYVENRRGRTVDVLVREKLLKIVHRDQWSTWVKPIEP
jgi:hypothetical protein